MWVHAFTVCSGTFSVWYPGGYTGSRWLVCRWETVVFECTENDSVSAVSDVWAVRTLVRKTRYTSCCNKGKIHLQISVLWCCLFVCWALCKLWGVLQPWLICWLRHYIYRLLVHIVCFPTILFMVALWNRADHYIFMMWFVLLLLLLFFPRLISAAADWMSAILPHMVWP